MRRRRLGVATLLIGVSCGCTSPREGVVTHPPSRRGPAVATVSWPYWPVNLRVHPLTRLVHEASAGAHLLEARIELIDRDGHTTKGVGTLKLELRPAGRSGPPIAAAWEQPLDDPVVNRVHYDDVTRTYLLRLDLDQTQIPARPVLHVRFDSADGRVLEDELELRTR